MFKFLEFRKVGALFLATLMLAVSCSQYEMKNELEVGVDSQEKEEITVDNTYGESLKSEQKIAFNYFYDNVKVCKLKTKDDVDDAISGYAKYRGIENYSVCGVKTEILSKYFTEEIDELGILKELKKEGFIDETTYNLSSSHFDCKYVKIRIKKSNLSR